MKKKNEENFNANEELIAPLITTQADEYDEMVAYKTLRQKRKKKVAIRLVTYALLIVFIPIFVFFTIVVISPSNGQNFFGYVFYVVETHSMEPELMAGDCIVVKKVNSPKDLKVGDDISYIRDIDGKVVTHRIVEIQKNGESYNYVTKGVNNLTNPTDDEVPVNFNNVIGKRVAHMPLLGQTVTFFRSPLGVVVMVLLIMGIVTVFFVSFRASEDIKAVGK